MSPSSDQNVASTYVPASAIKATPLYDQGLLAAHIANGHRRPITDMIIAATAELRGAEVLHVDRDYEMIAEVTGQPMRRLFEPGGA